MERLSITDMRNVVGGTFCECVCEPQKNTIGFRCHDSRKRDGHHIDSVASQSRNKSGNWTIVYVY